MGFDRAIKKIISVEKELFILLGTNLGDRNTNLQQAISELEVKIGKILTQSKIYQTAAWGITDQPDFLNQVLHIETKLKPQKVLEIILSIEKKMGRVRLQKWGARLIDIDILYYGMKIINETDLIIPHPFLQERMFTLKPLAEIAPNFIHPVFNKSNTVLMEESKDQTKVLLIEN
jgi:2-amino-4-hydroxy-6-hydroxymethyldihydropteridine diphosphokinase